MPTKKITEDRSGEVMVLLVRQRNIKGLSQAEASRRIGISQSAYCDWETGKSKPQPRFFKKLRRVLEINPQILAAAMYPDGSHPGEAATSK